MTVFNADRSSIFFVDEPRGELYARIFGVPPEETQYIEKVKESSIEMSQDKNQPLAFACVIESLSYKGQAIRYYYNYNYTHTHMHAIYACRNS